jgi:hypothetical protein
LWRVFPEGGCYDTCWLTGLWSTQAKVEGIMPKTAWHWGRDSNVVNDPLGEPGHTALYVGLPFGGGGLRGQRPYVFPHTYVEGSFLWTPADTHE